MCPVLDNIHIILENSTIKQQLFPKYQKAFDITERILIRLQNVLSFIPKIQLGQHLQLDTPLIVCIIFTLMILVVL